MRLIFSRKGWDASAGGSASPILGNGTFASLPIPSLAGRPLSGVRHGDLGDLGNLVAQVGGIQGGQTFHFDPDLYGRWWPRHESWVPAFGQDNAARRHLDSQGVGPGDLFLFFGWFREVRLMGTTWTYVRGAPDIHTLYGWLQVDRVIALPNTAAQARSVVEKVGLPWLAEHPHVEFAHAMGPGNCLYVAAKEATLGGRRLQCAGGGAFRCWHKDLQLTEPGQTRSTWLLPDWCFPGSVLPSTMSYHGNRVRWVRRGGQTRLRTVGRGQEFVLDIGTHPPAIQWLANLLTTHGH